MCHKLRSGLNKYPRQDGDSVKTFINNRINTRTLNRRFHPQRLTAAHGVKPSNNFWEFHLSDSDALQTGDRTVPAHVWTNDDALADPPHSHPHPADAVPTVWLIAGCKLFPSPPCWVTESGYGRLIQRKWIKSWFSWSEGRIVPQISSQQVTCCTDLISAWPTLRFYCW